MLTKRQLWGRFPRSRLVGSRVCPRGCLGSFLLFWGTVHTAKFFSVDPLALPGSLFIMQDFFRFKNGPFTKGKKTSSYATQKGVVSSQMFLNSSLTRRPWSFRDSEWHRLEVANRGSNLICYVITWYLIGFICNTINVTQSTITRPTAAVLSSKAHQFSCCVHRLMKRSRTSPYSPGLQPGTLGTASGGGDAVEVWAIVRQELSTSPS